jgi:hypothetical protein
MKRIASIAIMAAAATAALAAAAPAEAHGSRTRFSVELYAPLHGGAAYYGYGSPYRYGSPYHRPWGWGPPSVIWAPPPVVVAPPAVLIPPQPTVYVERSPLELQPSSPAAPPAAAATAYWYYCATSRAYYPYVAECPTGWQPVPSQPAR